MSKLVQAATENNIPESFLKEKKIETPEDVSQIVLDYKELTKSVSDFESNAATQLSKKADSDIEAWAASRADK